MILGAHQSISGGLHRAVQRGQQAGCDAIQLFNKSSNQWRARELSDKDVEALLAAVEETGVAVACSHTSYLINLASPDPELYEKSCQALKEELSRCQRLRIPCLVHHPGAHVGAGVEAGISRVAAAVNRLFDELPDDEVVLCLESTAGQGSTLGRSFEELATIIAAVEDSRRVGVCLDTCHLFAAGFPLAPAAAYRETMQAFAEVVGLERLRIFHLNDSLTPFGSHKDRHEHIGQGQIGLPAFEQVVNDPALRSVPLILETPKADEVDDLGPDIENLKVLRGLMRQMKARASTAAPKGRTKSPVKPSPKKKAKPRTKQSR